MLFIRDRGTVLIWFEWRQIQSADELFVYNEGLSEFPRRCKVYIG